MKERFTDDQVEILIYQHDVCPILYPFKYNGKTIDAVVRKHRVKVGDRPKAEKFSQDQYGFNSGDAITAFLATTVLSFGTLKEQSVAPTNESKKGDVQYSVEDQVQVPIDVLMECDYVDLVHMAWLMAKN
ncbi:hypothetical protein [Vibrio mediterranei]|uniref:hypothetical protein n=1 Tax=Vibrio mediterranei TaxID=689 RepID=UPI0022849B96|nr:hypothetical protein [Vibrio mediterranei]MCY9855800.1 hypothetical protein [Vibrio mediterranei]